jgi:hypothetical protein
MPVLHDSALLFLNRMQPRFDVPMSQYFCFIFLPPFSCLPLFCYLVAA